MGNDSLDDFMGEFNTEPPIVVTPVACKPFLKWAGGKAKLVPFLLDLFPAKVKRYYEPFIGGGAVFWAMSEAGRFEAAHINDWNDELVTTYRVVRDFPDDLVSFLKDRVLSYDQSPEATFNAWRNPDGLMQKTLGPIERAGRFIFLNKTAFNGLYRLNQKGGYNVPWGKYKNPPICNESLLQACSRALNKLVTIGQGDFVDACLDAAPGDLVYLDPPYVPVSETANFTSYTEKGFNLNDQYRCVALFRELAEKGVAVVLSNADTPEVRRMFEGFEMHSVPMRRNINSKGDKRGPVSEIVVVGRRAGVL
jgi:DNA adenine methylase